MNKKQIYNVKTLRIENYNLYLYMRTILLGIFISISLCSFAQTNKIDTLQAGEHFEFIAPLRILDDQSAQFYYAEANNYFLKQQFTPASFLIKKAISMQAENAEYWLLKAWIFSNLEQSTALHAAQQAAILKPNDWRMTYCLAYCKQISGDYVGAVIDYSKVIAVQTDNHLAYVGRANCKEALKDYEGAIADYSIAIMFKPTDEKSYLSRGILQYKINQFYEAISDLSGAIVKMPNNATAYYYRGLAYIELKDYATACTNFTKASELGNKEVKTEISRYCIRN